MSASAQQFIGWLETVAVAELLIIALLAIDALMLLQENRALRAGRESAPAMARNTDWGDNSLHG